MVNGFGFNLGVVGWCEVFFLLTCSEVEIKVVVGGEL